MLSTCLHYFDTEQFPVIFVPLLSLEENLQGKWHRVFVPFLLCNQDTAGCITERAQKPCATYPEGSLPD